MVAGLNWKTDEGFEHLREGVVVVVVGGWVRGVLAASMLGKEKGRGW